MLSKVLSIQIGKVKSYEGWESASVKESVSSAVFASKSGFIGDEVADKIHHGGTDKAIFANSYENYENWAKFLDLKELPFGALAENLTISGLHESSVCLGDIHKIGSAVLQVSQPRKPCWKISKRWDNKKFTSEIYTSGLTGWYYRVLEEGDIKAGDEVEIIKHDEAKISILEANTAFANPLEHRDILEKIVDISSIAESYKVSVLKRLEGTFSLEYMNVDES
ncbi:MAG: molybdenum cofactor biosysynthesis protein [Sulfurimonas sp. RIFOXYD12_FULL_33_39]|uniref:MOSC domain-containing protein n=1 Tax=unclassified Sulfurimonas TaxID=2623549 RepID=UPI0008ACD858|nr:MULTISPECIES: MOSC domain-containing protein [unclassified Sulfurimonas]OHE03505.1 MAG: molybdenum cofactor biosysynthesis protein [Sulfurimonas sp. RIFCSPLOWO2_12_FULL_34_6]OHE10592.1 MAG: molybdenum cofactor biosysynthesis protein [Sulfurimonas sp. RIFOXYD12_FULL_33_39]OHE15051.1 MAG: molybdenum cofactor biosysynthesis protein [Sulfurimonas sp. RIFOXYD2_FULL_34_21]DAB27699.1 MAG TPA: molybdenum cofactor biosysynthesis protein [Sulfurimonas sp. UBA10385]